MFEYTNPFTVDSHINAFTSQVADLGNIVDMFHVSRIASSSKDVETAQDDAR
jgi:hypothetical protein